MTNNREKIGNIVKSDGTNYNVYMLKTSDILQIPLNAPDFNFRLAAKSINVPYEEFLNWDITDSIRVITMFNNAFEVLSGMKK